MVRARVRSGTGVGRGYGILHHLAEREPSPPASRNRPPMPSDSDDDLSEMTVYDLDLETNAAVIGLDRYSDVSGPGSPLAAASLDWAAAMATETLSVSAAAEGDSAGKYGMLPSLDLASFVSVWGTSQSVETEESGPIGGVGLPVLGAVTSSDGTRPPGLSVDADPDVCDPVPEDPVRDKDVPADVVDADPGTANSPELTAVPETDDPLVEAGQGLSPTPEGTSSSLPCGQRVGTPESSDSVSSSYEIISDTPMEDHMVRRTAPDSGTSGTLGGEAMAASVRPPLSFDDLYSVVRITPMEYFDEAAENLRQTFQTMHDRDTLVGMMIAMTTARVAVATELRDEAARRVGDGQDHSAAFLELIRHLDDVRYCRPRSD